jgi:hypothetical protein
MKRIAPFVLVLATACGGGGSDTPTAPAVVVSVTIATTVTSLNIGETATLTATPFDSKGAAITGRAVTWASSNATIASVSTAGVVTAITAGGVVITATVDTKSAQAPITVTTSSPKCDGVTPASLQVGEVRTLTASERSLLCVSGGAAGAEYAIIPVNLSTTIGTNAAVSLISSNTVAAIGAPASAQLSAAVRANTEIGLAAIPTLAEFSAAARMPRNIGFERALRTRERDVRRSASAASRSASRSAMRSRRPVAAGRSNILGLPATPTLGTLVTLNANANVACTAGSALNRVGRVAAVSNAAIVVVDTTAPAGGFSDAEYLSIATTFDTLIYPLDTAAFGAPYDMDNNGRVLMFFTTAVNQLSAASGTSVIGGFFFERDLVPRVANAIVPFKCDTSNEGEMFYLPVVDVGSKYNPFFTSKANMLVDINSTTIHEFQHLINASRRYYVTPEIVESEEAWLGEGMSHLAEEILYLHVAGLEPKADLGFQITTGTTARNAALIAYQVDNLSRYNGYLKATEANSPYADNDDLATRGAGWALLRYSLDRSPNPPNTYLRALVNAPTQGIPNFNNVFASIGGLVGAVRTFVVANFTDNAVPGVQAAYQHGSWNFRDWLPHFTANNSRYPLVARSLFSGAVQSFTLVPGGSGYVRFRVTAGVVGGVSATVTAATTPVDFLLVRTQ